MPCGIPLEKSLTRMTVISALKKHRGVYLFACKELGVHRITLSAFVRQYPDLEELVLKLRHSYIESTSDLAEKTILRLMEDMENPSVALKSSMYHLNNQAKKRGYAHPDAGKDGERMTAGQALALREMAREDREKLASKPKPKKAKAAPKKPRLRRLKRA